MELQNARYNVILFLDNVAFHLKKEVLLFIYY